MFNFDAQLINNSMVFGTHRIARHQNIIIFFYYGSGNKKRKLCYFDLKSCELIKDVDITAFSNLGKVICFPTLMTVYDEKLWVHEITSTGNSVLTERYDFETGKPLGETNEITIDGNIESRSIYKGNLYLYTKDSFRLLSTDSSYNCENFSGFSNINHFAISNDKVISTAYDGSDKGYIVINNLTGGECLSRFKAHNDNICILKVLDENTFITIAHNYDKLKMWDLNSSKLLESFQLVCRPGSRYIGKHPISFDEHTGKLAMVDGSKYVIYE